MKSEEFETFWHELRTWLSKKQSIRNWTAFHQTTGEDFEAEFEGSDYVFAYPEPPAKKQRIPKADFKVVFENWEEYISGKVRRSELVHGPIAFSRFTKYTISIIHEYKLQKQE